MFSIGITGVVGVGLGLYALVFPAFGLLELLDSQPADLISTAIGSVIVFFATAVIAAELVLVRGGHSDDLRWELARTAICSRSPAAAIGITVYALAAMLAALL